MDLSTPLVVDNGSGMIKCGLATSDLPTSVFPNIIGWPRFETVIQGSEEAEFYIGHNAHQRRGALSLKFPVEYGIVEDWDSMEAVWTHMYQNELRVDPSISPVLITEAPLNPKQNREKMIAVFFETFSVPAFYLSMQAVLSLYSSGGVTGVVYDSGDGVTHIVPVFEGYGMPHAISRLNIAGREITTYLARILSDRGIYLRSSSELESAREMKEKLCYVAVDYDKELEMAQNSHDLQKTFVLPDGQEINIGVERFQAPEAIFQPKLIGYDIPGASQATTISIKKCDLDIRKNLYENILMSGGSTMYKGIEERLTEDLKKDAPSTARVVVKADIHRKFSVWIGGKILSTLASFSQQWIMKEEYDEYGPAVVHRKCF